MTSVHKNSLGKLKKAASLAALAWLAGLGVASAAEIAAASAGNEPETSASPEASAAAPTEVTVTARHRREVLQDVPLAITAVAGAELNQQHLDRIGDYAAKVPNFGALQQNPRVSSASIRGIGGNANNDGAESGVGLIVDNVFLTHVGFSWNDFVDLDGIEVVRGPQGTLLGKNTTIGAVIIKTKLPSFEPSFKYDVTFGNNNRSQARINATGPIIADKLAYRFTAATDQGDGWVTNKVDGKKYLGANRSSERLQLLFTPTANISDRLIAEHAQSHEYNNFYPGVGDANFNYNLDGSKFTTTANPTGARAGSWSNVLISRFGYTPSFYDLSQTTPQNADYNTQDRLTSKVDGLSNELNWTFNNLTLTSVTAWRKFFFRPANDGDYTPFSISRNGYDVDVAQYSQEFRLANQAGGPLDWQVGAYFLREDLTSTFRFNFYQDAVKYFVSPLLPAAILSDVAYSKEGKSWTQSSAVFGQFTWHVTDKASLTAGARLTREDKRVRVASSATGGTALTGALAPYAVYRGAVLASIGGTYAAAGGIFDISDAKTTNSTSWLINPSYKLSDNALIYGSASYGEKSGAANTTASPVTTTFTIPLLIRPEKSLDFEGGIKTNWLDKKLIVNVNFYNDTITNYQASASVSGLVTPYLSNVGKVRLRGLELESRYAVTDNLSLTLNAGYNDAKYVSYDDAPAPVELQAAVNAAVSPTATGTPLSLTGYQLVGVPKHNVQGSFDYHRDLGNNLQVFTYGNAIYHSKVSLYNPRSQFGWQKDLTLVNGGIGIRNDRYSLLFWGKNLTDKRYLVGFGSATAANPYVGILGEPRTYGVTFSGRF